MTDKKISCTQCGCSFEVTTYRRFTKCPYCGNEKPFSGFAYQDIDWRSSMYSGVKLWMDCPVCRSPNMYLGTSGNKWKCPDCGYTISNRIKNRSVFWFCDNCETFLNVQPGFSEKNCKWKCIECGYENNVTKENII